MPDIKNPPRDLWHYGSHRSSKRFAFPCLPLDHSLQRLIHRKSKTNWYGLIYRVLRSSSPYFTIVEMKTPPAFLIASACATICLDIGYLASLMTKRSTSTLARSPSCRTNQPAEVPQSESRYGRKYRLIRLVFQQQTSSRLAFQYRFLSMNLWSIGGHFENLPVGKLLPSAKAHTVKPLDPRLFPFQSLLDCEL